ncbi:unnamed protein product, partial [Amoebophrya sp. A120]
VACRPYHGFEVDVWSLGVVLCVLLTSSLPFVAPTVPELFRKICRVELAFPLPSGPTGATVNRIPTTDTATGGPAGATPRQASTLCNGFEVVRKILVVDSLRRFTLKQIQEHPWFLCSNSNSSFGGNRAAPSSGASVEQNELLQGPDCTDKQVLPLEKCFEAPNHDSAPPSGEKTQKNNTKNGCDRNREGNRNKASTSCGSSDRKDCDSGAIVDLDEDYGMSKSIFFDDIQQQRYAERFLVGQKSTCQDVWEDELRLGGMDAFPFAKLYKRHFTRIPTTSMPTPCSTSEDFAKDNETESNTSRGLQESMKCAGLCSDAMRTPGTTIEQRTTTSTIAGDLAPLEPGADRAAALDETRSITVTTPPRSTASSSRTGVLSSSTKIRACRRRKVAEDDDGIPTRQCSPASCSSCLPSVSLSPSPAASSPDERRNFCLGAPCKEHVVGPGSCPSPRRGLEPPLPPPPEAVLGSPPVYVVPGIQITQATSNDVPVKSTVPSRSLEVGRAEPLSSSPPEVCESHQEEQVFDCNSPRPNSSNTVCKVGERPDEGKQSQQSLGHRPHCAGPSNKGSEMMQSKLRGTKILTMYSAHPPAPSGSRLWGACRWRLGFELETHQAAVELWRVVFDALKRSGFFWRSNEKAGSSSTVIPASQPFRVEVARLVKCNESDSHAQEKIKTIPSEHELLFTVQLYARSVVRSNRVATVRSKTPTKGVSGRPCTTSCAATRNRFVLDVRLNATAGIARDDPTNSASISSLLCKAVQANRFLERLVSLFLDRHGMKVSGADKLTKSDLVIVK